MHTKLGGHKNPFFKKKNQICRAIQCAIILNLISNKNSQILRRIKTKSCQKLNSNKLRQKIIQKKKADGKTVI